MLQRVILAAARLEAAQQRVAAAQSEVAEEQANCTRIEAQLRNPVQQHTSTREDGESLLAHYRGSLALKIAEVRRLTADEVALTEALTIEQSRWMDLNRRLEDVEQAIGGR